MISNRFLLNQFMAAIDMVENAMVACPDAVWSDPSARPEWPEDGVVGFWYLAFHTLFWLDLYLSGTVDGFRPPEPFTLVDCDPEGALPERAYTKQELFRYLAHCRIKCRRIILELNDQRASELCSFAWGRVPYGELLLDNMRHVQHHAAQMNLLLRQQVHSAPRWVATSGEAAGRTNDSGASE